MTASVGVMPKSSAEEEVAEADCLLVEIEKTASAESILFLFSTETVYDINLQMGYCWVCQSWKVKYYD